MKERVWLVVPSIILCCLVMSPCAYALYELPICTADWAQYWPAISGDIVVWQDERNYYAGTTSMDVYGYDIAAGREFPVCTAAGYQSDPAISGHIVVWADWRNCPTSFPDNVDVFGYDLDTGREFPICTAEGNQTSPAISGHIVVWTDGRDLAGGGYYHIYGYDLATGQEFPICAAPGHQGSPAISGNTVVWTDGRNYVSGGSSGTDIYGKDLAAGREFSISTVPGGKHSPAVSGNIVVWDDYRNNPGHGSATNIDIYGYDLETDRELVICNRAGNQLGAGVSGNIVVWSEPGWDGSGDICALDLSTGREFPVCTALGSQAAPVISGNTVAWDDVRNGDHDIYGAVLSGGNQFLPYVANVTTMPDPALDGYSYYLKITVGNSGGLAGSATITLDESDLSGITMTGDSHGPEPSIRTKTIPAYGEASFYFGMLHGWDWISAPPDDWQAILDGAISCLPVGLIKEWAEGIQAADNLEKVKEVYRDVKLLLQAEDAISALLHDSADFRYLPGPETTTGLTFDTIVTVQVADWKTNAFWTSIGHSTAGTICSYAGSRAGVLGLPLLALQGVFKYAAHEYYEIAYDPDPDYMTLPAIEPIDYPELDALPDSPGKAAALAAKAWTEVETARSKAWVRLAAAEQAGDEYWRLRQAQAAEEFGRLAETSIAEYQRLLPAVPGLQGGSTSEEVAAFRQQLQTEGLPEIESAFLLRQGWTQSELDALVQSMLDTSDEVYQTPGLHAAASINAAAGALAQTAYAAEIADSPKTTLELPTTLISTSGTLGRDGKYVSDVMVLLEATSPTATAIAATDYSLDEGASWTAYAGPFTISEDGTTTILARATDSLARTEDPPARKVITKRPSVFSDVPFGSWAWAETEAAYWSGIVQGYTDGLYHPEIEVTRDQMAVYVSRSVGTPTGGVSVVDYQPPSTPSFSDVPVDHWAYRNIEYAVAYNIVQGYLEGDYRPALEVSRDQMAVYIARSMIAPTGEAALADYVPSDPRNFPDVPEGFWARKHVEYCVEHGVVSGYDDGYYHPEYVVTRDQMAVYIARAFGLL